MNSEEIQAIASIATFFTATIAVWASFRAPKLAAEIGFLLARGLNGQMPLRAYIQMRPKLASYRAFWQEI
jgi:hypothetical protein